MNLPNNNMSEILIKTLVKKSLSDIKESPGRNVRNLIDMALNFSNGRFQKCFFANAQKMLQNQHSAYYKLIQDIAFHVDEDRILTFGMNIGYTSCTAGAAAIRRLEQELKFNIPWSLTFVSGLKDNPGAAQNYQSIMQQGKELGIYTWLIFSAGSAKQLLPLIKNHAECAVILFCEAAEITEDLLDEAEPLHHLMFAVRYGELADTTCDMLRQRKFLYSVYIAYQAEDAGLITSGGLLRCVEPLHPAFTFFAPADSCPENVRRSVCHYVQDARYSQNYPTIPLDLIYDNRTIDSIISNDSCTACFDMEGNLHATFRTANRQSYNLFQNELRYIFEHSFPCMSDEAFIEA